MVDTAADAGAQGNAVNKRMQTKPEGDTHPAQRVGGVIVAAVIVVGPVLLIAEIMLVEVEQAQQQ